jgi:hypothetical protein
MRPFTLPFNPGFAIRLGIWAVIYLAAAYFDAANRALFPRWNYLPNWFFWHIAFHLPENLHLLIVGLLGFESEGIGDRVASVVAYGCFVINFILSILVPGKKMFWLLIGLLVVFIVLVFCGSSWYVSTVFKTI